MKFIKKEGHEPDFLRRFKRIMKEGIERSDIVVSNTFTYLKDDEQTNKALQLQLAKEQGYICCYCLREIKTRIDKEGHEIPIMKIEHFKPKSIFNGAINSKNQANFLCDKKEEFRLDLRIEYHNLFCACSGVGANKDNFCDTKKDKSELCSIPNMSDFSQKRFFDNFKYNRRGKMHISPELESDLVCKLNLNCVTLVDSRQAVWGSILRLLEKHWNKPTLERKVLQLFKDYSNRRTSNNKYYPHCDYILYRLKKRFGNILNK